MITAILVCFALSIIFLICQHLLWDRFAIFYYGAGLALSVLFFIIAIILMIIRFVNFSISINGF